MVNRYPGAACDVPSHLYSFSFEPNTGWTRRFSGQPEIRDYLIDCVQKHDLHRHLRLNTEIVSLRWIENASLWEATAADGSMLRARVVVAGTGALSLPATARYSRLQDFAGSSANRSNGRGLSLGRQRVGVIGTHRTPVVRDPAAVSTGLFQRSVEWILPKPTAVRVAGKLLRR